MSGSLDQRKPDRKAFLVRCGLTTFGDAMMSPYVGVYAVQLGANPAEMGWFQSLQNLSGGTMQLVWGMAMDRIRRPALFLFLGSVVGGLLWLPLLFVSSPQQIIVVTFVQGLIMSMTIPAALAVNDALVPRSKRSQAVTEYHSIWTAGTIPATLLSGYLMSRAGDSLKVMYFLPIVVAALFRAGSSFLLWSIIMREKTTLSRPAKASLGNLGRILQNSNLRILYLINFFHGFFVSFAWPLFPITKVLITKSNMFLIALLSTVQTVVSSATRPYFGRLADKRGKKPIILLGKIGIALVPLCYAFATEFWHLMVSSIFIGLFIMADSITQAYILEHSESGSIGTSLAFSSTVNGMATFLGSLAGGYLVNELLILGFEQTRALSIGFLVAAAGRAVSGVAYGKLREETKRFSTHQKNK